MTKHLLLIDASGFAYRAFHALNPTYRESDGFPTAAIIGFLTMLWRLLREAEADKPDYAAAIFDAPGPTFRHKLFANYKGDRVKADELTLQFPVMREAARTLGIEPLELAGFEADDVIATLARRASRAGMRTTIVSSDKDFGQLVRDNEVEIVDPMAKVRILEADVRKRWGVSPGQIPDLWALCGDAVDGIPGADGIGLKRGAALLRQHGSLEAILRAKGQVRPPALRVAIERTGAAKLRLYYKLATLRANVPVKTNWAAMQPRTVSRSNILVMLKWLEASPRMTAAFGLDEKLNLSVAPIQNPLQWWQRQLKLKPAEPRGLLPEMPQCGFYERRLVKNGPFVPARIWREPEVDFETEKPTGRDVLLCEVGGERKPANDQWGWLSQNPIEEKEFRHLMKVRAWAVQSAPDEPEANPMQPINFATVKPPTFQRPKRKKAS